MKTKKGKKSKKGIKITSPSKKLQKFIKNGYEWKEETAQDLINEANVDREEEKRGAIKLMERLKLQEKLNGLSD